MECAVYARVRPLISERSIVEVVGYVLKREKKPDGIVSVHIIGDRRMRTLNRVHRGKDKTTDVLSFSALEGEWAGNDREVGDIFISVPQIKRQAKTWEVTPREEFVRMLVHGVLHALGYDHITKAQAAVMFPRQEKYVKECL